MDSNIVENVQGYEFSENQKNLWQLGANGQQVCYNQLIVKFDKALTTATLKDAIHAVIERHEVLSFRIHNDKKFSFPLQVAAGTNAIDYTEIEAEEASIIETATNQLNNTYDATSQNAIRFCALKNTDGIQYLAIRLYTLWGDNYSILYVNDELSKALQNIEAYKTAEIEKIDYLNFCAWQNELLEETEEDAVNFWNGQTYTIPQKIVPFVTNTEGDFTPIRKRITTINGDAYNAIKSYCETNETTIEDVLLIHYANYLKAYTTDTITIGYIPSKRNYEELNDTLGLVAKQLPFTYTAEEISMAEASKKARTQLSELSDWADYFSLDRENKGVQETSFAYGYEYVQYTTINGTTLIDNYTVQDQFELKLNCIDTGNAIEIAIYYDQEKYEAKAVDIMLVQLQSHFQNGFTKETKSFDLTELERNIISTTNTTKQEVETTTSVLELFEQQVQQNPEATAIVFEDQKITYQELNTKANQFANYLVNTHKITQGNAVCVLLERSDAFVISVLGILKTGAYYVPIDTNYPDERVAFIINDTNSKLLVCTKAANERTLSEITKIDPTNPEIYTQEETFNASYDAENIAYCIYTSGSTGNPKGCLITNKSLVNYIVWADGYYFENENQGNWGLITSVSFDLTITALYTSLTRGKQLWIGSNRKDIYELLTESFNNKEIDTLKLTPTHLSILKELEISETNVSTIICGGEALTVHQIENVRNINNSIAIYNEYGPTEATVGCVVEKIATDTKRIVIGKPIANTVISILDENNAECPIGVSGELHIAGAGLAKGYLNRNELTESKFVNLTLEGTETRYYKTGDLARWLPDGTLEYIGRIDNQVKIRGYRIELGEIENLLVANENIEEAVVLVTETANEDKELTAFILTTGHIDGNVLKEALSKKLPEYMIPTSMVQIDKIPMTINGKVDTKYLLDLKAKENAYQVAYVAPSNEIEEQLVGIWQEILNKEKIGVNDDFFALGGNSLLVMKLMNKISHEFGVKIDFKSFFSKPTINSSALEITFLREQKSMNEDNLVELDI